MVVVNNGVGVWQNKLVGNIGRSFSAFWDRVCVCTGFGINGNGDNIESGGKWNINVDGTIFEIFFGAL